MTLKGLKKASERVQWDYQYMPTKSKRIHSINYPEQGHYRTFLRHSEVNSDVIGSNENADRVLKMFRYDAD